MLVGSQKALLLSVKTLPVKFLTPQLHRLAMEYHKCCGKPLPNRLLPLYKSTTLLIPYSNSNVIPRSCISDLFSLLNFSLQGQSGWELANKHSVDRTSILGFPAARLCLNFFFVLFQRFAGFCVILGSRAKWCNSCTLPVLDEASAG